MKIAFSEDGLKRAECGGKLMKRSEETFSVLYQKHLLGGAEIRNLIHEMLVGSRECLQYYRQDYVCRKKEITELKREREKLWHEKNTNEKPEETDLGSVQ